MRWQLLLSLLGLSGGFLHPYSQCCEAIPFDHMEQKILFGVQLPWNVSDSVTWVSVDDRVRGGSSRSHFDPIEHGDGELSARFWGNLDTKTLGGAGFASSSTEWQDENTSFDFSAYDGILLSIAKADDKTYTFIVKDETASKRSDGRKKSTISWEYDFTVPEADGKAQRQQKRRSSTQIRIPWSALKATYRGRDVKDPTPLKVAQIKKFSIMMRSFFEKQDGDFELILDSISVFRGANDDDLDRPEAQL